MNAMLTTDQLVSLGKVLAAYSWLQVNAMGAFGLLLEADEGATAVILSNLTLADRTRITIQLLERHASRRQISTGAFQGLDAALRKAFDLLAVPMTLPDLTFDVTAYAANTSDGWSAFNLEMADAEIEQISSAYLLTAADLFAATFVYRLELAGDGNADDPGPSTEAHT